MRRILTALGVAICGCGGFLGFGDDEEPSTPVTAVDAASADATVAEGSTGDAGIDPCKSLALPSFCEAFDGPALDTAWTKEERTGGTVSLIADGELGGALRGSAVPDPAGSPSFGYVSRPIAGAVRSIDCTFRARADAIAWNNTFDLMVVQSSATPAWREWFVSIFTLDARIGMTFNSVLAADGGNPQEYPRGDGGIAPDAWLDVHFVLSSADGWILHGSIGEAKIDFQLPSAGPAIVDPTLRFGLHYGGFDDGTTSMHVDVDRLVCKIETL